LVNFRERFSVVSLILVGFLMGSMFILGGVVAYKLYFPSAVVAEDTASSGLVKIGPSNIAQTVKQVSPAIVNITSTSTQNYSNPYMNDPFFRDFFGRRYNPSQEATEIGTGFIFDKTGLILTNQHVIEGATSIDVNIAGFDKPVKAKVIGADAELDLAVLKVSVNKELPVLKLGDSGKVDVGEWVIAIGSPYGLDHTVTVGVISAKGRPVTIANRLYKNLLQTDAAINPGNSGGPLLNTDGQVIGINTAVNAAAQGIGFAIPIGTAQQVLNDLVNKGKVIKSYVGVALQPLDEELAEYFASPNTDGALIAHLSPGGPAEKAGLQQGDIILEINKKKVKTVEDVTSIVQNTKVGESLVLKVLSNKETRSITVKTAEKP
jgi:S1-C subfamily serine protease